MALFNLKIGTTEKPEDFDPSVCIDPVAQQTSWEPVHPVYANFRTKKMVRVGEHQIVYKNTIGLYVFISLVILVPAVVLCGFLLVDAPHAPPVGLYELGDVPAPSSEGGDWWTMLPLAGIIIFPIAAVGMMWFFNTKIVFDKGMQRYIKRRGNRVISKLSFSEIYAMQVIPELIKSKGNRFYSYEINIVKDNGERLNVVDQIGIEKVRANAQTLATFLDVPLWDATKKDTVC